MTLPWFEPGTSLLPHKRTATPTTEPLTPHMLRIFFSVHLKIFIYLFDPTSISIVPKSRLPPQLLPNPSWRVSSTVLLQSSFYLVPVLGTARGLNVCTWRVDVSLSFSSFSLPSFRHTYSTPILALVLFPISKQASDKNAGFDPIITDELISWFVWPMYCCTDIVICVRWEVLNADLHFGSLLMGLVDKHLSESSFFDHNNFVDFPPHCGQIVWDDICFSSRSFSKRDLKRDRKLPCGIQSDYRFSKSRYNKAFLFAFVRQIY
jgi:hypothetical protein